ncbi:protein ECT2-like [Octopus sinensis]|uniref:Protein ECT2-like n=1 Tax=Octopus sinensis TaxID=2607531 RepID=A0A7E6ER73_9MOLL|nr:protein ECT2-like [Octopus sinensis]
MADNMNSGISFDTSATPNRQLNAKTLSTRSILKPDLVIKFVVVGESCQKNEQLQKSLQYFSHPVIYSDTGQDIPAKSPDFEYIFILDNFENEAFRQLYREKKRIFGPPVLITCARDNLPLPKYGRPLYCFFMSGLVLCITGIKRKEKMLKLTDVVHHMYGMVKKEISPKVTHLVANCCGNDKYRFSVTMGIPIMKVDWILEVWEHRDNIASHANQELFMSFRLKPFEFCYLSFYGFKDEDQKQMEKLTSENGGTYVNCNDERATHLVVDDQITDYVPVISNPKGFVVRAEWFWGSIQIDACACEDIYLFEKKESPEPFTPNYLNNSLKNRKRRLLQDINDRLNQDQQTPNWGPKRRSKDFADKNMTPVKICQNESLIETRSVEEKCSKDRNAIKPSQRCLVAMELLQTEWNYVKILHTILHVFKEKIEEPNHYNVPILVPLEIKSIFGKIPPIYDIHCKIRDELSDLINNWKEDALVGDVILKHADKLVKAYPPFVNFFEKTKESILECEKKNPRFHAFLKVSLNKPECGRQTLVELMIRPVQRLGSVILLLNEILKRTPKTNPDSKKLEEAVKALKEVLTYINEDKKKTENRVEMFDLFNDIECCPPYLLSSHRTFLKRVDTIELYGSVIPRGESLTLFLFSDNLSICKRRLKLVNSAAKSPSSHKTPQKPFKHLALLPLNSIKAVLDMKETDTCQNAFGLTCNNGDKDEWYAFKMDCDIPKREFQMLLCRSIADTLCRTDYEKFFITVDGLTLNVDTRDLTRSRALRIRKKVGRAFSFSKTPAQLKRAVSSVANGLSPFMKEGLGASVGTLGRSYGYSAHRPNSTLSLNEIDSTLSHISEVPLAVGDDTDSISLDDYTLAEEETPSKYSTLPIIIGKKLADYKSDGTSNTLNKYLSHSTNKGHFERNTQIYHV